MAEGGRQGAAATLSCPASRAEAGGRRGAGFPGSVMLPRFSQALASPVLPPRPVWPLMLGQGVKPFSVVTLAGGTVYLEGYVSAIDTVAFGERFPVLLA